MQPLRGWRGRKSPRGADKLNKAASGQPTGVGKLFKRQRLFEFGMVRLSFIAPFVFGFIRMFKEDEGGRNIYLLEERIKIASEWKKLKLWKKKPMGMWMQRSGHRRLKPMFLLYGLPLKVKIKDGIGDLEIKLDLSQAKLLHDAYFDMNSQARIENISFLYTVVESLTKVINRHPGDTVKLTTLRRLRDTYRRIYQDVKDKKAVQGGGQKRG